MSQILQNQAIMNALMPDAVHYIAQKAHLTLQQTQAKIKKCQTFDIQGQGLDLDTQFIEQVLKQNDFYQNSMQKLMKDDAIKFVKNIIQEWSNQIAKNQIKISKDQLPNFTAKALPFGSYVLDLKSNSSDIDLVCVCPSFINMQTHFFGNLAQKLEKCPDVIGLSKRIGARIPIITFDYKEINIDISYCHLQTETVPRDIQKTITNDLVNSIIHQKSRTAIIGRKNNLMILQLAAKKTNNAQNFKQTLRVIKVWAKNRGISSNAMGFLGGISWAIMLAKICQIFPYHKPNKLFYQFFKVYSMWNWKNLPIQIIPMQCQQQMQKKQFQMFVATPGVMYNSTQRVNKITFKVLAQQIKRAADLLGANRQIKQVCRKSDFIQRFPYFIEIDICGRNQTKQDQRDYKDFQGNVQSKILVLLINFIKHHKNEIQQGNLVIVPNPYIYKKNDKTYPLCNSCLIGVQINAKIDIGYAVKEWMTLILKNRGDKKSLNLRLFKTKKEELTDIQITQVKKKEQKKDPRRDPRKDPRLLNKVGKENP